MKKLLTSILICVIGISSIFSTVPKEDFNEVYDQLVEANNSLKELSDKYEYLEDKLITITSERDKFRKAFNETYDQLDYTTDFLKTVEESLSISEEALLTSNSALAVSNSNLEESNKIIGKLSKNYYFVAVEAVITPTSLGYSISGGAELFLDLSILGGITIIGGDLGAKVGVLYKF